MSDAAALEPGCRVSYGLGKTGVVRFVGETDFAAGEWVGLELPRADGKNNGEVNGRVYFSCADNCGLFVKRSQIRGVISRSSSGASSTSARRLSGVGTAENRRLSGVGVSTRASETSERRLSGVGAGSSRLRPPSAGSAPSSSIPRASTPPSSRTGSGSLPLAAGSASTPTARSALRSSLAVPSAGASGSSSGSTPVRRVSSVASSASRLQALDSGRRASVSRPAPSAADEQLVEALARIARLEAELEQKSRHVEQLKQSVAVMKEAVAGRRESVGQREDTAAKAEEELREDQDMDGGDEAEAMEVDGSGGDAEEEEETAAAAEIPEELLARQVESVKREAEEHVRAVRAELEEHVSQLQAEHEEMLDELRLENATQASEVKALEAEVAQQKARLAQFTAAEQKKAEEVALAVAKSSKGERRVEALEAQLAEFQDMVEMMTLEKETVEMDKEIAEERVEELQQQVDKMKAALALGAMTPERAEDGAGSSDDVADENKKLRAAVKALHERSSEEKAELSKKVRQLQRENTELTSLREEVEQLAAKRTKLEAEVEELKEMLDVANAYESMVEDLTEKNLTLGDKVAELETTVQSLESLREMDQEMEHQHTEYEAELRDEIDAQRAALQELKQALGDHKTAMEDKDRTIARFRELTHSTREEIQQLKTKLRVESGELESLKGTAHTALNQTMGLRSLAAAAREHEVEAAKQKILTEQARLESAYLRALIPSSILTEVDHKVLRVRLVLGRVRGKAEMLLEILRKDADGALQQSSKEDASGVVAIPQLLLADKLAAVLCQAQEDYFMLECHLTTEEEFAEGVAQLDTVQVNALESLLDAGLAAFLDGTLLASRSGEASLCQRLAQVADEWLSARRKAASSASEGFPARCAVVKLRARRSVASLSFSLSASVSAVRAAKAAIVSPGSDVHAQLRTDFVPVLDASLDEMLAVAGVAQLFHRRAEIDLAPADDDLEGLVAVGGDVVEMTHSCAMESQGVWALVQDKLAPGRLEATAPEELVAFVQQTLLAVLGALKDKVVALFKVVCRGAFTDAVAPRSLEQRSAQGRPQWQIRAQAIHAELLGASTLRATLKETSALCQALHVRIRELERAESQARVVTQKLESDALRLSAALARANEEKAQMDAQMAKEREQFNLTLDESHKDKVALDTLNRELRKQLQRSTEASNSSSRASSAAGKAAMSVGDVEALRMAFRGLQDELDHVRATLAKERLERVLGPTPSASAARSPTDKLSLASTELRKLTRAVKAELSMPRLVDLRSVSTSGRAQLVTQQLRASKAQQSLADLRTRIGGWAKADGWGDDVAGAISRGEAVFGWQPPEMERPPLLIGRVTLAGAAPAAPALGADAVQLVMDRSDVQRLTQTLVC